MKKIGVLTSGGDAPGMNSCIRAVVRTAIKNNVEVVGISEGYQGLINGDLADMDARDVGGIIQQGGTILKTARSEEFKTKKGQREAIREINESGIDGMVIIGGDGSLRGARALAEQGIKVVGVPASIDNDIYGTKMSIGVDTALNTIIRAIDQLRDTASSHNRAFLVETMGRNCGYLALIGSIIGGAEYVLLPEIEYNVQDVAGVIEESYMKGKNHAIIVVAEGAMFNATRLSQGLKDLDVGFKTRVTILGHVQRGGSPTAFDRLLGSRLGTKAVQGLISGKTDVMVGLQDHKMAVVPLAEVVDQKRALETEYLDLFKFVS
ncbi:MAG: 6-phosphofructokinase [Chloroflexota bacterium]